jgi:hypothetical protein
MKTLKDKIAELPIEDQIKIHNRAARLIEMELRQRNLKFKGFLLIVSCILLLYVTLCKII